MMSKTEQILKSEYAKIAQVQAQLNALLDKQVAVINGRMSLIIELSGISIDEANEIVGAKHFGENK